MLCVEINGCILLSKKKKPRVAYGYKLKHLSTIVWEFGKIHTFVRPYWVAERQTKMLNKTGMVLMVRVGGQNSV